MDPEIRKATLLSAYKRGLERPSDPASLSAPRL